MAWLRSRAHLGVISTDTLPKKLTKSRPRLLNWTDLPKWQQEWDSRVETGYRPPSRTILECYQSWLYLHNESINIYSHVVGALLFVSLPLYFFATFTHRYKIATAADLTVCILYFIGVSLCFMLSVTFHTTMNRSRRVYHSGNQLDLQGIIILMWGATIPLLYYGFQCDSKLRSVYWFLLTICAIFCSILTFQPRFREPRLKPLRAFTYASFAASITFPVVHATFRYGWAVQVKRMGLVWIILTLIFNSIGAISYALEFPERWWRRKFDIFGASHQILHVMVIFGGLAFTVGLLEAFDFLHEHGDTCGNAM